MNENHLANLYWCFYTYSIEYQFDELHINAAGKVCLANGDQVQTEGIVKFTLNCQIGCGGTGITADGVLYIHDLKANLLSVITLSQMGSLIPLTIMYVLSRAKVSHIRQVISEIETSR